MFYNATRSLAATNAMSGVSTRTYFFRWDGHWTGEGLSSADILLSPDHHLHGRI